jgi:signal transduction histidine kinase
MELSVQSDRNRRIICNAAIIGTYIIIGTATLLLGIRLCMGLTTSRLVLFCICLVAFVYIIGAHVLAHKARYLAASYMIVAFYTLLASGIIWTWGINTPTGLLLFGLVIVLAGILLTARHALYMAIVVGVILLGLQTGHVLGIYNPDTSWHAGDSSFGDVFAYWAVCGMLALASWLYNREMERSLDQAIRAEKALLKQKATLELQVRRRTSQLRKSQLEELQQMYRVTELGQIGISLLHDLANNLTALQIEIEGIDTGRKNENVEHARQITHYLGDIVESTRSRIHGVQHKRTFNIIEKTNETIAFLRYKANAAKVEIDWQQPAKSWRFSGDPVGFGQVLTLLISNAIDAYESTPPQIRRQVAFSLQRTKTDFIISIGSWSKIDPKIQETIFKPFSSSKKTGMGLGLYMAKQTIVGQFGGTLTLHASNHYTEFIITLPRQKD